MGLGRSKHPALPSFALLPAWHVANRRALPGTPLPQPAPARKARGATGLGPSVTQPLQAARPCPPSPPPFGPLDQRQPLVKMVASLMRRSVRKKAGFDISLVAPLDLVGSSAVPAVFGHATGDKFIHISHSGALAGLRLGRVGLGTGRQRGVDTHCRDVDTPWRWAAWHGS